MISATLSMKRIFKIQNNQDIQNQLHYFCINKWKFLNKKQENLSFNKYDLYTLLKLKFVEGSQ